MDHDFNLNIKQIIQGFYAPFPIGKIQLYIFSYHEESAKMFASQEHEHPFFEFSFVREGTIIYEVDGCKIELSAQKPQIILLPSQTPHYRFSTSFAATCNAHLVLEPITPGDFETMTWFRSEIKKQGYCFDMSPVFRKQDADFIQLVRLQEPYWVEFGRCKLIELFLTFFSFALPTLPFVNSCTRDSMRKEMISRILYTIRTHAANRLNVRSHAKFIGLSERQLSRLIQDEFGMPPGRFIMLKRIEFAKQLLAANTTLVKNIAASLGFSDTSHFCRVFRAHTGMTPRQYVCALEEKE